MTEAFRCDYCEDFVEGRAPIHVDPTVSYGADGHHGSESTWLHFCSERCFEEYNHGRTLRDLLDRAMTFEDGPDEVIGCD